MRTTLKKVLFLGILIAIWEVIYKLQIWPSILFPSPIQVGETLYTGIIDGSFIIALGHSFKRLLIGYGLALIIGTILGLIIASSKLMDETLGALVLALQSVPSIVWLPLAILWFGMGESAIIFVVILGGTWNMVINASTGIKNVHPLLIKAAKTMGVKGYNLFFKVTIPAAIPHLITGMRLSWAFCWRALMAGELLGSGNGLGQILMWGREMGNMSIVISIMIIIASLGSLTDSIIFKPLEDKVLERWGLTN
ncbi:ABC transporter permease [Orenia marismortui]|uniref:ABC transporter permease n=1 Tax=Orenia marismortui TaxID=46469 RepID=UPI001064EDD5|nr:ABC transporter permease [Orenia marismortui]